MPTTEAAPCSRAYRQCQPNPHPQIKHPLARQIRQQGTEDLPFSGSLQSARRAGHLAVIRKKTASSYLFCFIH